jgi:hypothetical protein
MILTDTMIIQPPSPTIRLRWARRLLLGGLVLLFALNSDPAAAVPKTDVITLVNGDIITCEIKEMSRGKLRAKTDHLGEVSIKWDKITKIVSNYWFLISLKDGSLIYGQMSETSQEGQLVVNFQEKSTTIPLDQVVEIDPVRYDLWNRFDMSAAFGLNWNKGSDVFQANVAASVKYKGVIYSWGLDGDGMVTEQGDEQGDEQTTRRNNLDLWLGREISGRYSTSVNTGTTRNDELGLRRRVSLGLNGGYFFLRSSHLEWRAILGATVNREWSTGESDPANSAEGRVGTEFTLFYHDTPKSDITVQADVYPNFTVTERVRFEGSITGRQEIIKDLFLRLDYYESRDSKPPDGANATSDRGIVFSIEWTK